MHLSTLCRPKRTRIFYAQQRKNLSIVYFLFFFVIGSTQTGWTQQSTDCNTLICDGFNCDDGTNADGVQTDRDCGCGTQVSGNYACALVLIDLSNHPNYDVNNTSCTITISTQQGGGTDIFLADENYEVSDCSQPYFSPSGNNKSFELPGGQLRYYLQVCKTGNSGRRDLSVSLSCAEDCTNNIDDDGDGKLDCDDGDCASLTSCTVSGGGNGGLETHGELADKIALLDHNRTRAGIDFDDRLKLKTVRIPDNEGIALRNPSINIESFLPVNAIPSTGSYETSPTDLTGVSNAIKVRAMDIYEQEQRIGVVLALESENGVYEHSKYVCDRVKGARIQNISQVELVSGIPMIVAEFFNNLGGREFGTLFSIALDDKGQFSLDSHWSTYDYPAKDRYFNFQVWANSRSKLEMLVAEIINLVEERAPLTSSNSNPPPSVIASQQRYEGGYLYFDVLNVSGAKSITFEGAVKSTETAEREYLRQTFSLNGETNQTIRVSAGSLYSMGGLLKAHNGKSVDQIYFGDGAWGNYFDPENATLESYRIESSHNYDHLTESSRRMERNLYAKGTVRDRISFYRALNPGSTPEDVSGYSTLTMEIIGSGQVEIILAKDEIDVWGEQPRHTIELDGQCSSVYLRPQDFFQKDGLTSWHDVKSLTFVKKGNREKSENFELEIKNVAFANVVQNPPCDKLNRQEFSVFPNPVRDRFTINLSGTSEVDYDLSLFNTGNTVVQRQTGKVDAGAGIAVEGLGELPSGLYFYVLDLPSGQYRGKVVVAR